MPLFLQLCSSQSLSVAPDSQQRPRSLCVRARLVMGIRGQNWALVPRGTW